MPARQLQPVVTLVPGAEAYRGTVGRATRPPIIVKSTSRVCGPSSSAMRIAWNRPSDTVGGPGRDCAAAQKPHDQRGEQEGSGGSFDAFTRSHGHGMSSSLSGSEPLLLDWCCCRTRGIDLLAVPGLLAVQKLDSALQASHQDFVGGGPDDSLKLRPVVGDQTHFRDHDVVDEPAAVLEEKP